MLAQTTMKLLSEKLTSFTMHHPKIQIMVTAKIYLFPTICQFLRQCHHLISYPNVIAPTPSQQLFGLLTPKDIQI